MQRRVTGHQIREAHSYMVQFVEEYENLYYQRRGDRLHFNRPCVHTLIHTPYEILRVGNGCNSDQYTMERSIGILGKRIRQPSNPFGNLAQLALQEAQVNALLAICPELDNDASEHIPQYSQNLGDNFILLRPRDKLAHQIPADELVAVHAVCPKSRRQRWGRLQLPNGQIARSRYSEKKQAVKETRVSRNVKVDYISFNATQIYSIVYTAQYKWSHRIRRSVILLP